MTALAQHPAAASAAPARDEGARWQSAVPLAVFYVATAAGCLLVHPTMKDLILCDSVYVCRTFILVVAYHRYFSHRSFATSRAFQLVLGLLGASSAQQGPLWWAWAHRHHHRYSDRREDFHSPLQHGLFWSHMGWVFAPAAQATDDAAIRDLSRYPELRWLDRYWAVPLLALAAGFFVLDGWHGLIWGFAVTTVLLWQASYCVNSLAHLIGDRRFPTRDGSRNNFLLALLTLGEGWHNNHHYYPRSMWQGFYWWQIDVAGYGVKLLEWLGLVWDVRGPPPQVLALGRPRRALPARAAAGLAGK
ncbi:MAG TPA: fatty acid desaturase [Myxococcales bacterium]|nr:fatty acid desaturase [Myxococcales bacterium]